MRKGSVNQCGSCTSCVLVLTLLVMADRLLVVVVVAFTERQWIQVLTELKNRDAVGGGGGERIEQAGLEAEAIGHH